MKRPHFAFLLLLLTHAHLALAQSETPENAEENTITCAPLRAAIFLKDSTFTLPWPQNVQQRLDSIVASGQFETTQMGLLVYDLTADSVLFRFNERQLLRPASTMKLLTAITALDRLGSRYRFRTRLYYTGIIDSCALRGSLYCRGGMDPAFSAGDMAAFVESVRSLGIDTIFGNVVADLSMKEDKMWGEGWCWDDDNPVLKPLLVGKKDRFLARFMQELRDSGIVVMGDTATADTPSDAQELCTRYHNMEEILRPMMKNSDNLFAESTFYQLAAASGHRRATAGQARHEVNRLIQKLGFQPSDYYVADGSGLSLYNYVTAELEVAFLRYAYKNSAIYVNLLAALPKSGTDGTLEKRLNGDYVRGNVQAKTGTLTGVSSLAGYLTAANGHRLCFSIINQGQRKGSTARACQDRICEALCEP